MIIHRIYLAAAALTLAACGPLRPTDTPDKSDVLLPTGRVLHPAGHAIDVGNMPLAVAVAPGGRYAALLLGGWRERGVQIVDVDSGRVVQTLPQAGAFVGLAFSPDGRTLFASGAHRNVIYMYGWDGTRAALQDSIILGKPDSTSGHGAFPAGLALSPDGRMLYVAENMADTLAVIDVAQRRAVQQLKTGHYPYGVVVDSHGQVFVSNWGDSTVNVYHAGPDGLLGAEGTITVGRHPSALALNPTGTRLYTTLSSTDQVAVVDPASRSVIDVVSDAAPNSPHEGSTPNALTLDADGRRLYVAEADNNAVGVFTLSARDADVANGPSATTLDGRIPTLWYPTALTIDRGSLLVVSGKGRGTRANPGNRAAPSAPRQYTLGQLDGTLSVVPATFDAATLATYSARVASGNGWSEQRTTRAHPPFEHVILVIRENRTYDQVLGDIPAGDGDTSLVFFPRAVTPNGHALAERFGLYDRFFVNAEVSAQGHPWTTSAYVTEYTEKTTPIVYADRRADTGGNDVDAPSTGFLWTDALRKGLAFRNYGEDVSADTVADASGSRVRWTPYRDGLAGHTDSTYAGFDLRIPDQVRADEWQREFAGHVKNGAMPPLEIVYLPRDHTAGARAGWCTPRACVADNDLALGRIIEALSHSPFWKSSLVLVVEDDAQAGPDHVDSHRSVMLAISPWSRAGTVSRFVNTTDVLATAEEMLGLAPLSQFDRFGHPLADWRDTPDLRPYDAIQPTQSIAEVNKARGVGALESRHIDLADADRVDDAEFNRILWKALKPGVAFPAPRHGTMLDLARER